MSDDVDHDELETWVREHAAQLVAALLASNERQLAQELARTLGTTLAAMRESARQELAGRRSWS